MSKAHFGKIRFSSETKGLKLLEACGFSPRSEATIRAKADDETEEHIGQALIDLYPETLPPPKRSGAKTYYGEGEGDSGPFPQWPNAANYHQDPQYPAEYYPSGWENYHQYQEGNGWQDAPTYHQAPAWDGNPGPSSDAQDAVAIGTFLAETAVTAAVVLLAKICTDDHAAPVEEEVLTDSLVTWRENQDAKKQALKARGFPADLQLDFKKLAAKTRCWNCKQVGHLSRNCTNPPRNDGKQNPILSRSPPPGPPKGQQKGPGKGGKGFVPFGKGFLPQKGITGKGYFPKGGKRQYFVVPQAATQYFAVPEASNYRGYPVREVFQGFHRGFYSGLRKMLKYNRSNDVQAVPVLHGSEVNILLITADGCTVTDSGTGLIMVGMENLKGYERRLAKFGLKVRWEVAHARFKFGNDSGAATGWCVIIPFWIGGRNGRYGLMKAFVVGGTAPLLLSNPAHTTMALTVNHKRAEITSEVFPDTIAVKRLESGHFELDLCDFPEGAVLNFDAEPEIVSDELWIYPRQDTTVQAGVQVVDPAVFPVGETVAVTLLEEGDNDVELESLDDQSELGSDVSLGPLLANGSGDVDDAENPLTTAAPLPPTESPNKAKRRRDKKSKPITNKGDATTTTTAASANEAMDTFVESSTTPASFVIFTSECGSHQVSVHKHADGKSWTFPTPSSGDLGQVENVISDKILELMKDGSILTTRDIGNTIVGQASIRLCDQFPDG